MLKNLKKNNELLMVAGKYATTAYVSVLTMMIFVDCFLLGTLITADEIARCFALSAVSTGAAFVLLGTVNVLATIADKIFKKTLKNTFINNILLLSVFGKEALPLLFASGVVFTAIFAMGGWGSIENIVLCISLIIALTGMYLVIIGALGIFSHAIKVAFLWLKKHKISLIIEEH